MKKLLQRWFKREMKMSDEKAMHGDAIAAVREQRGIPAWTDPNDTDDKNGGFSDREKSDMVAGLELMDDARLMVIDSAVRNEIAKRGLVGDLESIEETVDNHRHQWIRGVLPGNVEIKSCKFPGCTTPFIRLDDHDLWLQTPSS